jgi:putative ABC transport system ATP-binding protein
MRLFEDLGEDGLTLVVITHDAEVAQRARRCIRIADGRVSER